MKSAVVLDFFAKTLHLKEKFVRLN